MLTYRLRPRTFKVESEIPPTFPANVEISCHFTPKQPFGGEYDGGRTARLSTPATAHFDANTGRHSIRSETLLEVIGVRVETPTFDIDVDGAVVKLKKHVSSLVELAELVDVLFFALPPLITAYFADPVVISRIDGIIGAIPFRWELQHWQLAFDITDTPNQEKRVAAAIDHLFNLHTEDRRLYAALHYFHVATRLDRVGATAGEFMAEAILNYSKILEVLFPPSGGEKPRDAARNGLAQLGYSAIEIDRDFLPAMALRNEVDVGHVDLALFNSDQLLTLHRYTERAEFAFREFLSKILSGLKTGGFRPPRWAEKTLDTRVATLIARLKSNLDSLSEDAT